MSKPMMQLSYLDLQRLSGYTPPKRPCYLIHNHLEEKIAYVIASHPIIALNKVGWLYKDCDIVRVADRSAGYGVLAIRDIPTGKDEK